MALKCLFLEEDEHPPPAKPPDMVLIVPLRGGLSSGRLSCWFTALCSPFWFLLGSLCGSLRSGLLSSLRSKLLQSDLSWRGRDPPSSPRM